MCTVRGPRFAVDPTTAHRTRATAWRPLVGLVVCDEVCGTALQTELDVPTGETRLDISDAGALDNELHLRKTDLLTDKRQTEGNVGQILVTWSPHARLSLRAGTALGLNVWSGPTTGHSLVASRAGGSTHRYDILGQHAAPSTWWKIQFRKTLTGWVHGSYVQPHGNLSDVRVVSLFHYTGRSPACTS